MKRLITLLFLLTALAIVSACTVVRGNGNLTTESYDVSGFNRIEFNGFGNVILTAGDTESVTIRTDENLQDLMRTEVRGSTLYIGQRENTNTVFDATELTFTVMATSLDAFVLSGAGDVNLSGIESETFDLRINGAGDATLSEFDVQSLQVDLNGAGSVTASGRADELDVDISGAGDFSGFELTANSARIDISGAGSGQLNVMESLTGSINGAGDIRYRGNPEVDVQQNGVGSVSADG